jgi:hypothetical protein
MFGILLHEIGTVMGWISETDIDKAGEPGYVCPGTGKPARLYHIVFPEESHHQYASLLLQTQDLEEYELLECLIDEKELSASESSKKKARLR